MDSAFPNMGDEEFERIFMNILDLSSKSNTYKFAFIRFLLQYSNKHTKTHVGFSTIAEYFLEYYWVQECKSKLKQSAQIDGAPIVIKIIRDEFEKEYYPQTFKEIKLEEPEKIKNCIKKITKECFHDVTWRVQNVKMGINAIEKRVFFNYKIKRILGRTRKKVDLDYGIILNPTAMSFFKRYNAMLNKAVTLEWAKFLENLNLAVPRLISKTEGEIVQRTSLGKYRKALEPFFKNCFYCDNELKSERKTQVEHVIPFDFIAEDEMWNFVLACQDCNCKKLGSLPPRRYLKALIERNKKYRQITLLDRSLVKLGSDFEKKILDHYENAKSQGYMVLQNFP